MPFFAQAKRRPAPQFLAAAPTVTPHRRDKSEAHPANPVSHVLIPPAAAGGHTMAPWQQTQPRR
jgi:hypothetical protein